MEDLDSEERESEMNVSQFSIDKIIHFDNPGETFRALFDGDIATLVDGTEKPVHDVTDEEVLGYKVASVYDVDFDECYTADRVARA